MSNGQPPVLFTVTDGVATITLNSPPTRNAFGGDMPAALSDAYRRCDADDDVRAVVLTGTPPAFCSGADLSEGGDTFRRRDESTFSAAAVAMTAWQVRKPVIAAVNGHAIGVGLTLALQCDIRIFAGEAKYGIVQVRRGVMGDGFSHWTLPRITGMSGAAEILLTGSCSTGGKPRNSVCAGRSFPMRRCFPPPWTWLATSRSIPHRCPSRTAKRFFGKPGSTVPKTSNGWKPPTITGSWGSPIPARVCSPSWRTDRRVGRAGSADDPCVERRSWRTSNEHRCLRAQGDRPRRPNRGSRCSPGLIRVSPTVCATHSRARTRPSKSWRSTSGGPATRCSGAAPRRWWRRSFRGPSGWALAPTSSSPTAPSPSNRSSLPLPPSRMRFGTNTASGEGTGSRWRPPTAWSTSCPSGRPLPWAP